MPVDRKASLAEGRAQGRAVRAYLEALDSAKPKRGRRRTTESIEKRLSLIGDRFETVQPFTRLALAQERLDLEAELRQMDESQIDLDALEADFVAKAGPYAARKGLSYDAFRAVGVQPAVLARAGIKR